MMGKTLIVNSTRDAGDQSTGDGSCFTGVFIQVGPRFVRECTLRAAIEEANATTAADTINFNIAGAGPHTISPTTRLPFITHPVTINGYSQPGISANTAPAGTNAVLKIVLDRSDVFEPVAHGLVVLASNSTVKGLVINGFSTIGVQFGSSADHTGNTLEGCFIGADATGTTASGNGHGVLVGGTNNVIGGTTPAARNLISGNDTAILLGRAASARVEGNLIGTSKDGIAPLRNSVFGIIVQSSGNTIGGSGAARNTIAFNGRKGCSSYPAPDVPYALIHPSGP
jgi:CSLREA domain-containing protein